MINLDSKEALLKHDPKGMYALTVGFPDQVAKAVEIGVPNLGIWCLIRLDQGKAR